MSVGETILRLIELGATPEMVAAAAEGMVEAAKGDGRSKAAIRQARYRERNKPSHVTEGDGSDAGNEGSEQKVPRTLKTKQTNNNPPSSPTGTQTPKGVPPHRGTSLPDDWQPSESHFAKAEGRSFDRDWVGEQARRMRDWALGNRNRPVARKADWDRTFHGWIDREMDKARPNGSRGPPMGHPDLSLDGLKAKIAERSARERATH